MSDAERDEVVAIASDHGGFDLKQLLSQELVTLGYQVLDLGTHGAESVDYPTYAEAMADALLSGRARRGVLLCGTGIGVSIAANRRPGIRAALCHHVETARPARKRSSNFHASTTTPTFWPWVGGRRTPGPPRRFCAPFSIPRSRTAGATSAALP